MHMLPVMIVFIVFSFIFTPALLSILTEHRRKMMEMQIKMHQGGDSSLRAELEALRQEVRSLRDTATQYDLSFDTALQRIEGRVQQLERKNYLQQDDVSPQNLTLGR